MASEPGKTGPNFEDVGRKLDRELKQVIDYLNDEVVPTMRQGSGKALRKAAEKLSRLADYMDEQRR